MKLRYKKGNEIFSETDHLIGADGPLSQVAKSFNMWGKRKFMTGLQARVKLKNENYVEFHFLSKGFAWIVPENKDTVRLGVASYENTGKHFEHFLKIKKVNKKDIINKQAGLIPIYNKGIKTQKQNVFLVGDAATQVKATTGGGIIQGLIGAECLAEAIINNKNYEKEWKKRLAKELGLHLKIRNVLDKFKEKDWNLLTNIFSKEKNKQFIESFDRDNLSKFFFRLILKEPGLLCFLKYLI